MLSIIGIVPHPPIIIPEIGRGELKKVGQTVKGMKLLSSRIAESRPEALILITPHGRVMPDGPAVLSMDMLSGDFGQFGFPAIRVDMQTDRGLIELLEAETATESVRPVFLDDNAYPGSAARILDHGAMVPLYYLRQAGVDVPGLHLTIGFQAYRDLYRFGSALRRAVNKRALKTAVLASGDLSHRLTPGAPAGFSHRGAEFDQKLLTLLREERVEDILQLDSRLVEEAGECGLRSFIIALGMFEGERFYTDIISYEGPFGVGYLVASLHPGQSSYASGDRVDFSAGSEQTAIPDPVALARTVIGHYLKEGKLPEITSSLDPYYKKKAAVFVSLKKEGQLRGCIGTVEPTRENLAEEIAANAVGAAARDPRFPPVEKEELPLLDISVDILGPMEKVSSESQLDPLQYGVMVKSGTRSGLLLPALEGIDSAGDQVGIALRKAGIDPGEPVELYRFQVIRFREKVLE